ncbi:transposase [Actinokineospora guangxiensis]|uniref:Transposase n=1 Tax=Actinokineospora guangxiensis TaxID=1490288 RepID=A0ABW0ERS9_9PSEU
MSRTGVWRCGPGTCLGWCSPTRSSRRCSLVGAGLRCRPRRWRWCRCLCLQFAEGLSDRQAAHAVRARIDWEYALGLELVDQGLDHSVLSEFRARTVAGGLEQRSRTRCWRPVPARG